MHLQKIQYLTYDLGQGHKKCCPVPSSSCDLKSLKVLCLTVCEEMHLQEIHYWSFDLDLEVKVT